MGYVFVSYSAHNAGYARRLAEKLRAQGFDVWIASSVLGSGDNWWKSMVLALKTCDAVVVVMTPESKESRWVQREVALADEWQKPIHPILLAGENWEMFILTHYEDVRQPGRTSPDYGGILPDEEFYRRLAEHATRKSTTGVDLTSPTNQDISELEPAIAAAAMNPPPRDIPPGRAAIYAAVIGGLFLIVAAIIPLLVNASNQQRNREETETAEARAAMNALTTQTAVAMIPTVTGSPTSSSTPTMTPTSLDTPTNTPTDTPSPTATATETATPTPSLTDTPRPSETPPPLPETPATIPAASVTPIPPENTTLAVPSYPCAASIVYNRTGLLNIVRGGPSSHSSYRQPIQQGAAIRILSKDQETRDLFWYRITDANGTELGWIPTNYAVLSASCPE